MWQDINWEQRSIEVCQNFQRVLAEEPEAYRKTECILLPPKSYSSIRVIPLTSRLYERLRALYNENSPFVFCGMKKMLRLIRGHCDIDLRKCWRGRVPVV